MAVITAIKLTVAHYCFTSFGYQNTVWWESPESPLATCPIKVGIISVVELHKSITQSWAAQGLYKVEDKEILAGSKENKNVHED